VESLNYKTKPEFVVNAIFSYLVSQVLKKKITNLGTGKSTLIKSACELSSHSLFINAIGTSSCGLTVTVAKDRPGNGI